MDLYSYIAIVALVIIGYICAFGFAILNEIKKLSKK